MQVRSFVFFAVLAMGGAISPASADVVAPLSIQWRDRQLHITSNDVIPPSVQSADTFCVDKGQLKICRIKVTVGASLGRACPLKVEPEVLVVPKKSDAGTVLKYRFLWQLEREFGVPDEFSFEPYIGVEILQGLNTSNFVYDTLTVAKDEDATPDSNPAMPVKTVFVKFKITTPLGKLNAHHYNVMVLRKTNNTLMPWGVCNTVDPLIVNLD